MECSLSINVSQCGKQGRTVPPQEGLRWIPTGWDMRCTMAAAQISARLQYSQAPTRNGIE
jgi:hypothetical protein